MITAYETQTVGNAMIQAIVAEEIKRQKTAREAELEKEVHELQMQLDLRRQRDEIIYTRFIDDADRYYYAEERHWILGDVLWAVVGWVCLAFYALFDAVGL